MPISAHKLIESINCVFKKRKIFCQNYVSSPITDRSFFKLRYSLLLTVFTFSSRMSAISSNFISSTALSPAASIPVLLAARAILLYSWQLTSSCPTPPHPIRITRSRHKLRSVSNRLTDPEHEGYACSFTAHVQARQ